MTDFAESIHRLFSRLHGDHAPVKHDVKHKTTQGVTPTLDRVCQLMASILRVPASKVHSNDCFASLTGWSTGDAAKCDFDDDTLDLVALEIAIKDMFKLEIPEEDSHKLFRPETTAAQFAAYIDEHHSHRLA